MATIDLGRVTPIFHGDYDNTATYELNDLVIFNDNMYWHVGDTPTTGTDPTDTTVWKLAIAGAAADLSIALAAFPTDTVSGSIASISDGADNIPVKAMTVQIEPSQDLHGYDAPWPAGGGANKWDEQWEVGMLDTTTGANIDYVTDHIRSKNYIPVVAGQSYRFVNNSATSAWFLCYDTNKSVVAGAYLSESHASNASGLSNQSTFTVPSGVSYLRFYLVVAYGTTYNHDVGIMFPSTVTTYSPYSNLCPITGWTGANIVRTGANIYDQQWELGSISATTGELTDSTTNVRCKNAIPVLPSTAYRAVFTIAATNVLAIHAYDANGVWLGMYDPTNDEWRTTGGGIGFISAHPVFTTPANTAFIRFRIGGAGGSYTAGSLSINYPDSNTAYEPFGTTYTVSWQDEAGTIYVGTLDVTTGVLTVTHFLVDLTSLTWIATAWSGWRTNAYAPLPGVSQPIDNFWCENYKSVLYGNIQANVGLAIGSSGEPKRVYVNTGDAAIQPSGNAVFPLGTVQTYQLAPVTVATLLGNNNIWADCGPIELQYRADTGLYIDKKLGA